MPQPYRFRAGLSTDLIAQNPTLAPNEIAIATDTGKSKLGTGTSSYNALPFIGPTPAPGSSMVVSVAQLVNDYTGGADKAASAETVKTLKTQVDGLSVGATNYAALTGAPADNTALANALAGKADATATTNALAQKAAATAQAATEAARAAHAATTGNAHALVKGDIGLGSVANLAPADLPVSTATQAALDALTVGTSGFVTTADSATILLDKIQGRDVAQVTLTANRAFVAGPTPAPVNGGYLQGLYVGNGTAVATFPGWTLSDPSYAWDATNGVINDLIFYRRGSVNLLLGRTYASGLDVTAPTLVSVAVANSTPTVINLTFSEALNPTMPAISAFTVSAGHTLTAITYVDATHVNLTTSAAFVNGEAARTLAYTAPGTNPIQDVIGNLLANFTAQSITNNVGVTAPGAATLAAGTSTSTTQPLTITAPSTGGAPTSYAVFYKRAIDPTYSAGPTGSSLTPTVTGLTASTSYNFKVVASNAAGSGPDSNVVTNSTAAGGAGSLTPATTTPAASRDVTAVSGQIDYAVFATTTQADDYRKGTVGAIGSQTLTNATRTRQVGTPHTRVWTDAGSGNSGFIPSSSTAAAAVFGVTTAGTLGSVSWPIPMGTAQRKVRVLVGGYWQGAVGAAQLRIKASLSDGSATPLVINIPQTSPPGNFATDFTFFEFTYNGSSAGTLLFEAEFNTSATTAHEIVIGTIEYGT